MSSNTCLFVLLLLFPAMAIGQQVVSGPLPDKGPLFTLNSEGSCYARRRGDVNIASCDYVKDKAAELKALEDRFAGLKSTVEQQETDISKLEERINDVDECTEGTDECDQLCNNTFGSYNCDCNTGYILNDDGKTCTGRCRNSVGSFPCEACNDRYTPSADGKWCDAPIETAAICPDRKKPIPCYTGRCLQPEWWCDSYQFCGDGEDEANCPPGCTGNNTFQCDDGGCEPFDFVCNGPKECDDGSDEADCDTFKCTPGELKCRSGGSANCVDQDSLCDGYNDCDNGEDEQDCV